MLARSTRLSTRRAREQRTAYFEQLLDLKEEQLALRTSTLLVATGGPTGSDARTRRARRVDLELATRDQGSGGPARELERLRRSQRVHLLLIEAYATALMDAAQMTRKQADEAARAAAASIDKAKAASLLGVHSGSPVLRRARSAGTQRRAGTGRAAVGTDVREEADLRARLDATVTRHDNVLDAYKGALTDQHDWAQRAIEREVDLRDAGLDGRHLRTELQRVRADLDESEQENELLRREVSALQDKLMALLTTRTAQASSSNLVSAD